MKKYNHLRVKARVLRQNGATLEEICEQLSLSKSTIYSWIKDLDIPRTTRQSEQLKKATQATRVKHEELRGRWYEEASEEATILLQDQTIRDFIILYAAEGYKRDRNQVSICNSNPAIMHLAQKCIMHLSDNPNIEYRLQCHADNDESELRKYWASLLSINPSTIKIMRKSNAGMLTGRKWRSEYGVLTIRVGDTKLRSKIQALMDFIQQQWL